MLNDTGKTVAHLPCPKCDETIRILLEIAGRAAYAFCANCTHEGPHIPLSRPNPYKAAIDGWNALRRDTPNA